MFELLIILAVIILLYWRIFWYNNLIDDWIPRDGYLYVVAYTDAPHTYYKQRRKPMAAITSIGVFVATCGYIYLMWGFLPALLFSVSPLCVNGTAWSTGSYSMSTVMLLLATHYFALNFGIYGIILSLCFYGAALNSSLNSLFYGVFFMIGKGMQWF